MRKLIINSRDLSYTIDTYGMFTGDSVEEMEIDYYATEYNLTNEEARSIEFDYDHSGIVKYLAENSIQLLHENFVQHGNGIVKDINLTETFSPRFYNYTTDSYEAEWEIDTDKLEKYIEKHKEEFEDFVEDEWSFEFSTAVVESDLETQLVAMLDFYTRNEYGRDSYEMDMFEMETEAYYENMQLTEESEKLIDNKAKEMDDKAIA